MKTVHTQKYYKYNGYYFPQTDSERYKVMDSFEIHIKKLK